MFIKNCHKTEQPQATADTPPPEQKKDSKEPVVDPCLEQRRRDRAKRGVKICPKAPPKPVAKVEVKAEAVAEKIDSDCLGICLDRIKNPLLKVDHPCGGGSSSSGASSTTDYPIPCIVERQLPGTARCDRIRDAVAAFPDRPPENCSDPPPPPPPPPPKRTPCEEQLRQARIAECKKRMQRYLE